jgi:hypothetical protein
MVTYFNKKDLISFGQYLLSEERTEKIVNHPEASKMAPVVERLKEVHDADYQNWQESLNKKKLEKDTGG